MTAEIIQRTDHNEMMTDYAGGTEIYDIDPIVYAIVEVGAFKGAVVKGPHTLLRDFGVTFYATQTVDEEGELTITPRTIIGGVRSKKLEPMRVFASAEGLPFQAYLIRD